MGISIREIRDNTTRARHLMQRSRQQHFAVGAFNIDNRHDYCGDGSGASNQLTDFGRGHA